MEKQQIFTNFLFQLELDRKATDAAYDINDALCTGTTVERTVEGSFKKFRSSEESFGDEERSVRRSNVDND